LVSPSSALPTRIFFYINDVQSIVLKGLSTREVHCQVGIIYCGYFVVKGKCLQIRKSKDFV